MASRHPHRHRFHSLTLPTGYARGMADAVSPAKISDKIEVKMDRQRPIEDDLAMADTIEVRLDRPEETA